MAGGEIDDPDAVARAALGALVRERREDYAGLSRLIGRNPAYIQQYVKRGSPRRLAEADRRRLADYLGVPESLLGGPQATPAPRIARADDTGARGHDWIAIPRLDIGASAGPGGLAEGERPHADLLFPPDMLRAIGAGRPAALSLIRVAGDSMVPTLGDGDDILVDRDDAAERLRDGIYVLRVGEALIVKRVAVCSDGGLAIASDNPLASPDWSNVAADSLAVIGRVIWAGRRIR